MKTFLWRVGFTVFITGLALMGVYYGPTAFILALGLILIALFICRLGRRIFYD
jgi:hypothetical protein